jgi:hypothetical protein
MNTKYFALAALALPINLMAQTTKVDFEDAAGYKSVGVYDTWEESPFRTGELKGNAAVIDNFLPTTNDNGDVVNDSKKIVGVQRSRFGSNTFGVRVDLNTPFDLTPEYVYVHVKMYKPLEGRVMLVGLGKRPDRAGQSNDVEQVWVYSSNSTVANQWFDAVFPIKACNGVQIHSLVVVPDVNSPQEMTSDYAAYIDDIEVNNSAEPRIKVASYYGLNYDKETAVDKPERYVKAITLQPNGATKQSISVGSVNPQLIYRDVTDHAFTAKAGQTVTPSIDYQGGGWMNGFVYLDKGDDGQFDASFDESTHKATKGCDLVSYYYLEMVENQSGYKYDGTALSGNDRNNLSTPAFTLPSDLQPGFYRMRYKVDWGNLDPAGRNTTTNSIKSNGGFIVDTRLNVHTDKVSLSAASRNGFITLEDGTELVSYQTDFGKAVKIKATPANGFEIDSLVISHGYNLTGNQYNKYGTKQYDEYIVRASDFNADGTFTIPARIIDGEVSIDGQFRSTTGITNNQADAKKLNFKIAAEKLYLSTTQPTHVLLVDDQGRVIFNDMVNGKRTLRLHKGVYVLNDEKILVD